MDAAAYTLSVIDTLSPDFLSQNRISPKHVTVIGNGIFDEEAVRCGAAAHSTGGLVTSEEPGGWCLGDWCTPQKVVMPESYVNMKKNCTAAMVEEILNK